MSYYLSGLPLWGVLALLVVAPTIAAMTAQALIRRWAGVQNLVGNNEVAGFKFATVGVIYAVLLAFAVFVVWERFNDSENTVTKEAAAATALFRYAQGPEPEAATLRAGRQLPQAPDRSRVADDGGAV